MKIARSCIMALVLMPVIVSAQSPTVANREIKFSGWNIKTNLLYDLTTTINLGVEFRTGERTSLDVPFNYNPWTFSDNRKWKHFLVQPELRLWTRETFNGHFFGLHGHYAFYNVGNLPHGPFSQNMRDSRYQGWAAGAGVSYGYRWNFRNPRWAMEATVGVGYAYMDYDKYECRECGDFLKSDTKHYFGPTKVGVSLVYNIGRKAILQTVQPVHIPPAPVPMPMPMPMPVEPVEPVITPEPQVVVETVPEPVKEYCESGRAYLDFAVGRSEIVADFMNNAAELRKIGACIQAVKSDPSVTITGITITGYASPEGGNAMNLELSERRAQALKSHIINTFGMSGDLITATGAGEDWAGLEKLVQGFDMSEKSQILGIIRDTGVFEGREANLMRLSAGRPYLLMKAEMFPSLRRVEYEIRYTTSQR